MRSIIIVVCMALIATTSGFPAANWEDYTWGTSLDNFYVPSIGISPSEVVLTATALPEDVKTDLEVLCPTATPIPSTLSTPGTDASNVEPSIEGKTGRGGVRVPLPVVTGQPGFFLQYCIISAAAANEAVDGPDQGYSNDIGDIFSLFSGDCPPGNSLPANGAAYLSTDHQALYDVIQQKYGAGDISEGGTNDFNVPNLQRYRPIGADPTGTNAALTEYHLGANGHVVDTAATNAMVADGAIHLPTHEHLLVAAIGGKTTGVTLVATDATSNPTIGFNIDVRQPWVVVNYLYSVAEDSTSNSETFIGEIQLTTRATADDTNTVIADGAATGSPDFRGRIPVGAGQGVLSDGSGTPLSHTFTLNVPEGSELVSLTNEHVPDHVHHTRGEKIQTVVDRTGAVDPFSIIQPSMPVNFIIAYEGVDPTGGAPTYKPGSEPIIGEVRMITTDTIPSGWLLLDGTNLNPTTDSQYSTLAFLVTNGDASSSFNLPDLRGRVPMMTELIGSSPFGDIYEQTLTVDNLPVHFHSAPSAGTIGDSTYIEGPAYVRLINRGASGIEFRFQLEMTEAAAATAYSETCQIRTRPVQINFRLPGDSRSDLALTDPSDPFTFEAPPNFESLTFQIGADCTLPSSAPTGGDFDSCVSGDSLEPGESCTFKPLTNFKITSGSLTVTCPNTEPTTLMVLPTFGPLTDCLKSDLPALPAHGTYGTCTSASFAHDSTCKLGCATGYSSFNVAGDGTQTCATSSGQWVSTASTTYQCLPDCTTPTITDATTTCGATFAQGSSCVFTAGTDFYFPTSAFSVVGDTTKKTISITCQAGAPPTVDPSIPTAASSSKCSGSGAFTGSSDVDQSSASGCKAATLYTTGATCDLKCSSPTSYPGFTQGYGVTAAVTRTCTNSVWSGATLDCLANCDAPTVSGGLRQSNTECTTPLQSGGFCKFSPAPNMYQSAGPANGVVTCTDGTLSTGVVFSTTNCEGPPDFSGTVGATRGDCAVGTVPQGICTLGCDTAAFYTQTGGGQQTCTNGAFSGSQPACQASCTTPASTGTGWTAVSCPHNPPLHGDTCTYTLATDYYVTSGALNTQCSNGNFQSPPTFASSKCAAFTPSGAQTSSGITAGACNALVTTTTVCQPGCATGYTVATQGQLTCTNSAYVVNTATVCAAACDSTTITIPGASAVVTCPTHTNGISTSADVGSSCFWTADTGMYKSGGGDEEIACTATGFASNRPIYSSAACTPLSITGHTTATWGTCESTTTPGTGIISGSCQMGCNVNTIQGGSGAWSCTNAQWTGTYPICGSPCNSITYTVPNLGQYEGGVSCPTTLQDGETCEFEPITGNYFVSGDEFAFCNNGNLVQASAVYASQQCADSSITTEIGQPASVTAHAAVGNCGATALTNEGATCQLECAPGYTRVSDGNGLRTCHNSVFGSTNGNNLLPTCKADCTALSVPTGATLSCTDFNHHGSVCTYTVLTDFYLTAQGGQSLVLTCNDGAFGTLPIIASSLCDPPPLTVPHGTFGTCHYAGHTHTTEQCQMGCATGYTRNGGGAYQCTNSVWTGTQPDCAKTSEAFVVDAPTFVPAGETVSIVFTASNPASAAGRTITATCTGGYISCGANACLSNTCQATVAANKPTTLKFTAPNVFSMTPVTCSYVLDSTFIYPNPPASVFGYGSPAALTIANFPAMAAVNDVITTGTITPEWGPAMELTIIATCDYGSIKPIYLAPGATTSATITYTAGTVNNVEDTCSWEVRSTDSNGVAGRFITPADSHIKIGTPPNHFDFPSTTVITSLWNTGVEAGDAIAIFVKPSAAPAAGDLTLTLTCSGGSVGSATWPAGQAPKLKSIPYVAAAQCGIESCTWSVTSTDANEDSLFEVPRDAGWLTIPIAQQTQAYKQWRNQVRIASRKP